MKRTTLAIALSLACISTNALDVPKGSKYDSRIQKTVYNPLDVVRIDGVTGKSTHIILEHGEKVIDHAFGDGGAWHIKINQNHIWVKPAAEDATTNLSIFTDRRSYELDLIHWSNRKTKSAYQVSFSYPDTEERKAAEEQRKIALEAAWKARAGRPNWNYEMGGDLDISPTAAGDDGRFTYFRFAPGQDIPAVYQVGSDEEESLVNKHVEGDVEGDKVILHKVTPVWMLRLGDRVLKIWNVGYRPRNGLPTETRTISPQVRRVLKNSR